VVQQNGEFFAWVKDKTGAHRRLLLLGQTNDKVIQITDGVKEGDEVILNPRAVIAEAQPGGTSPIAVENADRFGAPTPSAGTRPSVPDTKPSSSEPAKKNGAAGQAQA
jgi:HlyD family secretion protein